MNDAQVIHVVWQAIVVAGKLAGPVLLVCLGIGTLVSLLQTVTQIQEMTLTFVPKLVGAALVIVVAGPWMIRQVVGWVQVLWSNLPAG
jgi:flagellar biosynthetic protein FliQ